MPTDPEEVAKAELGQNIMRELGDTGLKRSWGLVGEEFVTALQGTKAAKVYQEMQDNDPIVGAVLYALKNIVRQVTWTVQGPQARFVDDCRHDMSHTWEDLIDEALSKLPFGWAYHEICYKERADGRIGWQKIPLRSQDSLEMWDFDEHGGVKGMWQNAGTNRVLIPMFKSLLFRTTRYKNNPEGRSILRNAYRPWWFKKRIEEIEAVGVERDLAGIPKIGVPPELLQASPGSNEAAAIEAFKNIGQNLRNDEQACVIFPLAYNEHGNPLYSVDLMSSGGRRAFVTGEILMRYAQQIAMTCLADVILIGHEKVGSFALSGSKEQLMTVGIQSQVDEIGAVFNKFAIPRLLALNGVDESDIAPEKRTRVVAGQVQAIDVATVAETIYKLAMAGMPFFPSDSLEDRIRSWLDLPAKDGDELLIHPNSGTVSEPGTLTPTAPPAEDAPGDPAEDDE